MSLLEGLNGEETREKVRSNYWPILFVNWQVWPLLQVRFAQFSGLLSFGVCAGGSTPADWR